MVHYKTTAWFNSAWFSSTIHGFRNHLWSVCRPDMNSKLKSVPSFQQRVLDEFPRNFPEASSSRLPIEGPGTLDIYYVREDSLELYERKLKIIFYRITQHVCFLNICYKYWNKPWYHGSTIITFWRLHNESWGYFTESKIINYVSHTNK